MFARKKADISFNFAIISSFRAGNEVAEGVGDDEREGREGEGEEGRLETEAEDLSFLLGEDGAGGDLEGEVE